MQKWKATTKCVFVESISQPIASLITWEAFLIMPWVLPGRAAVFGSESLLHPLTWRQIRTDTNQISCILIKSMQPVSGGTSNSLTRPECSTELCCVQAMSQLHYSLENFQEPYTFREKFSHSVNMLYVSQQLKCFHFFYTLAVVLVLTAVSLTATETTESISVSAAPAITVSMKQKQHNDIKIQQSDRLPADSHCCRKTSHPQRRNVHACFSVNHCTLTRFDKCQEFHKPAAESLSSPEESVLPPLTLTCPKGYFRAAFKPAVCFTLLFSLICQFGFQTWKQTGKNNWKTTESFFTCVFWSDLSHSRSSL